MKWHKKYLFLKRKKKVYHSTPWKKLYKSNLSSFQEEGDSEEEKEETEEDDTADFKTIISSTMNEETDENMVDEDLTVDDFLNLLESDDTAIDSKFGVHKEKGKYLIGSEPVTFADGKIFVNENQYVETPGLLELLFKKKPRKEIIKDSDIKKFQEIAKSTNLLKKVLNPTILM